ncbi:MAG: hypothetical protein KIT83_21920 [Bryobacterales bacterium]|nr:hypothetical protein [Bryobacterales bacterium]
MKLTRRSVLAGVALPACKAIALQPGDDTTMGSRMLLCGGNAVYDARLAGDAGSLRWEHVRTWRPERSTGLPLSYALTPFATTDDCKPIDDGKSVLVTSSAGGVAIYRRDNFESTFHAMVANAHSACLLPEGHLVVAASTHADGNALVLFHRDQAEEPLFRTPCYSAHGVEWDAERNRLYALGMETLEEYSFSPGDAKAQLRKVEETKLPSPGGHELSPGAVAEELFVSSSTDVFVFEKETRTFAKHPGLGGMHHVKSISVHPQSGQLSYIRADEGVWWTFQLRFLNPAAEIESPGQRLYKARWA